MNIPIEYYGTAASVIVAVSLTQKNIKRLRILNLIGAAAFSGYGFMIEAWPVLGLNAFICIIDLYYLIEMRRKKNYFELLYIENPGESVYLKKFLEFYFEDIKSFMPDFNASIPSDSEAVFILRDLLPVSLVLYRKNITGIEILADYAIPSYRDMKNAQFFFGKIAETITDAEGVFTTNPGSSLHNRYLEKIGFVFSGDKKLYIKD